jgi:iron complex outermembrane receptor protein
MLFAAVILTIGLVIPQSPIQIEVLANGRPVDGATVTVAGTPYTTDKTGVVEVTTSIGTVRIEVSHEGFFTVTKDVPITGTPGQRIVVRLEAAPMHEEEVTVSATRTDKRLEDQAMRVEVLEREEIEEKMLMTPGDIVMMLNEMGGMRVQATSPALGAASVRMQGMRGRYTRVFSDGLPLFGEQTGGIGLLQIPPMDLGQVEVIKGVASALYGSGAVAGVIDLVSRRPGEEPDTELLVNQTTREGTDAVFWHSSRLARGWGITLLGSGHLQAKVDVDDDRWADLPEYARGVFRPRLFWEDGKGRTFFSTIGITAESREGGTMNGGGPLDARPARVEALDTLRLDGGLVARSVIGGTYVLTTRAAAAQRSHDHTFGDLLERDRHLTLFGEVTLRGARGRHTWVAGAAIERDAYRPRDVPRFAHTFTTPGIFVQDDLQITPWWSASVSARADRHSRYGWFVNPRLSSLLHGGGWTSRVSFGTGFSGPSVLTEETEAAGLTHLAVPRPLRAERGRSFSVDLTREIGIVSATATAFRSTVKRPIHVERVSEYALFNLDEPTTNTGVELLATARREPFAITGSYTYVRAREHHDLQTVDVPLTPRHSAGLVAMAEWEDRGRIGVEWYYTGEQRLENDPSRTRSEPYLIVGLLAERRIGAVRIFVNGENLTNTRQTHWSPLLRPFPSADGRITVDAWAPLEGRAINGGVRITF